MIEIETGNTYIIAELKARFIKINDVDTLRATEEFFYSTGNPVIKDILWRKISHLADTTDKNLKQEAIQVLQVRNAIDTPMFPSREDQQIHRENAHITIESLCSLIKEGESGTTLYLMRLEAIRKYGKEGSVISTAGRIILESSNPQK